MIAEFKDLLSDVVTRIFEWKGLYPDAHIEQVQLSPLPGIGLLFAHIVEGRLRSTKQGIVLEFLILVGAIGYILWLFYKFVGQPKVELLEFINVLLMYGTAFYVFVAEVCLAGGASWLTKKRGSKWVKEMEYPYLAFGLVGMLIALNRMDLMQGRVANLDLLGPLILVTAVVIKLIKTRAEIYEWQKL
jgi:hypothetical protein